jgi:hypothetical protein
VFLVGDREIAGEESAFVALSELFSRLSVNAF